MSRALHWYGPEIGDPPPPEMVARARSEWGLRLSKFHRADTNRHVAIRDPSGVAVGFYTPHQTASGVRFGPIYVVPEARGSGHAAAVYARWAARRRVMVYAEDGNDRSAAAALAGGLRPAHRGPAGQYYVGGPDETR